MYKIAKYLLGIGWGMFVFLLVIYLGILIYVSQTPKSNEANLVQNTGEVR